MLKVINQLFIILTMIIILIVLTGCKERENESLKDDLIENKDFNFVEGQSMENKIDNISQTKEIIATSANAEDIKKIELLDIDGNEKNYSFEYQNETFSAIFSYGNWRIIDSYKIKNRDAMLEMCQELIKIHPIQGNDGISYRTAEDMVYEWEQHNLAYMILPDGNHWKENAKNVDFDSADQGRTLKEMYEARTEN